ncbi:hypothetical protein NQ315_001223 [Exocentrus adspersus]|uniref:Serine protease HTRA2, mitochondrial n=1 Tax=Exocentrus adspersus TaxID=1586481 RepID=A0AAV8WEP3_9CUCU|nr:hypothetical protein NQ315_001223 [Exocentrus adspersus]
MNTSLFKTPSPIAAAARALSNVFFTRQFSTKKTPLDLNTRKINILGAAGIGSILLASYVLIKKSSGDEKLNNTQPQYTSKRWNLLAEPSPAPNENATTTREKYNFINKVVKRCAPAVFYLEIRDPYRKDLETGEPIITSNGSGFLISDDGWALTNAHVVLNKPQSTITAVMRDNKSYKVHVEDVDMNLDLALLKLDCSEKMPSLQLARPGDTSVGEWVVALGSPLSLSNSVTVGIVSCVNRPAGDLGLRNFSMTYIQTDASITFGNSGGPLVNLDGDVIGINNLRLTSGISFAIPVEYVNKFLDNSKYRVKVTRNKGVMGKTLLGIATISITPEVMKDLLEQYSTRDGAQGLLVWKVVEGTPASECGMEVGDIITHVNGVAVKEPSEMYFISHADDVIEIKLIHKGKKKTVKVRA